MFPNVLKIIMKDDRIIVVYNKTSKKYRGESSIY